MPMETQLSLVAASIIKVVLGLRTCQVIIILANRKYSFG